MESAATPFKGRGAASNPANRFEQIYLERDAEWNPDEDPAPRTLFLRDNSQTAINYNKSPDVGFEASINPYRGCEHGCVYCFARPTHEYLGFSSGLDFETKIMVKEDLPELLRKELSARRWKPQVIAMCGVTDCYQPIERKLRLTRRCLEVLTEFRNPVCVITKNFLVTRDVDLYRQLAEHNAAVVNVSITTLDEKLTPKLEPRASLPRHRLAAVKLLSDADVPVNVMIAPVIPGLTDHEMPSIIQAAREAGARSVSYTPLRLPFSVAPLFEEWLSMHFPDRKEKVLNRIRAMRGGKLNDPNFGSRMRGEGIFAEQMNQIFHVSSRKAGFDQGSYPSLSAAAFRVPGNAQLSLL
ncbi:MAG: PA0069 family radical SAM protein [Verrucomicrobiota bacterium]